MSQAVRGLQKGVRKLPDIWTEYPEIVRDLLLGPGVQGTAHCGDQEHPCPRPPARLSSGLRTAATEYRQVLRPADAKKKGPATSPACAPRPRAELVLPPGSAVVPATRQNYGIPVNDTYRRLLSRTVARSALVSASPAQR